MIGYFVRHPNAANLLMISAVFLGLSVVSGMERETFPEFTPSRVTVDVVYTGASAIDVDEGVCQELDRALDAITQLDELECVSTDGLATATLTMAEGGDITQFYNDVLSTVLGLNDLPDEAEEPIVAIAAQTEQIALLAVSGIDRNDGLLRYADRLAAEIAGLPMVSDATVSGISESEYRVTFDQRDVLMQADPKAYFITDHYTNYEMMQVRLSAVEKGALEELMIEAWRTGASKRQQAELDGD